MTRFAVILVPFLLGALMVSSAVRASSGVEISPFLGALFGGQFEGYVEDYGYGDIEQDDAPFSGVRLTFLPDEDWGFETTFAFARTSFLASDGGFLGTDAETISDVDLLRIYGAFVFLFGTEEVAPFVDLGGGVTFYDFSDPTFEDKARMTLGLGGGTRFRFSDHVGMRFDIRGYMTYVDPDSGHWSDEWSDGDEDWEVLTDLELSLALLFSF
jgi:hypothetical protein